MRSVKRAKICLLYTSSSEYAYLTSDNSVWTGMYGASEAQVKLENGGEFTLVQSTDYPFDGAIRFTAKNVKVNAPGHLRLRVPGWAAGGSIKGAGADRELTEADAGTYLDILVEDLQNMDVPVTYTHLAVGGRDRCTLSGRNQSDYFERK